ncbi:MAG: AAA family ATPase [Planctomycetes bacterium]|nr:AAA family ATPase [Planctomycetota bacterium]
MEAEFDELVRATIAGEDGAREALAEHLRTSPDLTPALLARLAREFDARVRAALALVAASRVEPEFVELCERFSVDRDADVRTALAEALSERDGAPNESIARRLLGDREAGVRHAVLRAAARVDALNAELRRLLHDDESTFVRCHLAIVLRGHHDFDFAVSAWIAALDDEDEQVARTCGKELEHWSARAPRHSELQRLVGSERLLELQKRVEALGARSFPKFLATLAKCNERHVDLAALRAHGRDLTADALAGELPRGFGVDVQVDTLVGIVKGRRSRAAVLLGDSGVGKTAIVHELVHRLAHDPEGAWRVVQISPAEFLAGTKYLGEWQTKLRGLVDAAKHPRRVVLYVPNLQELSSVGKSESSDDNVASMLAPHLEDGSIAMVGESTPAQFTAGLGGIGPLRRLFLPIEVRPARPADALAVLQRVAEERGRVLEPALLERIYEFSEMFLASAAQPGRAIRLLRDVLASGAAPLSTRDVLATISRSTGVPIDLLDDETALDLADVRGFFEKRVMGQSDALDTVVDLVTLIKAGLTDPAKPMGVFLFVGPTGVGKTELARALAEFLFGDPARLMRFDMSEYSSSDSYERLIGARGRSGLLTRAVREQPFAVLLLDEIEKAHANVFDLCLQLFDAGRLTDGSGVTADFRRTVVILTSNIGSAIATEPRVGFANSAQRAPGGEDVERALREFFRPEFLNRIDRIVRFAPLAPETADRIARRELERVLERGGIERRDLVLDVDPNLIGLLVRLGYSPAFGARPLKRTVERLVLLPVARVIASGSAPAHSILRLTARDDSVDVEIVAPEPLRAGESPRTPPASLERLRARGAQLLGSVEAAKIDVERLVARKSELVNATGSPGFWEVRQSALETLDELHRIDELLERAEEFERVARGFVEALLRAEDPRQTPKLDTRLGELEDEARTLLHLVRASDARPWADALLVLTRLKSRGAPLGSVDRLARMYLAWAARRGFSALVVGEVDDAERNEDVVYCTVHGAGAYGLLAAESGVHQLARGERNQGDDAARENVLVEVWPAVDDGTDDDDIAAEVRSLRSAVGRHVAKPTLDVRLVQRTSRVELHAWSELSRDEAVSALAPFLAARVAHPRTGRLAIVRRYQLGPSTWVRDRKSGEHTGRLDRVMGGGLDRFLVPNEPGS